MAAVIAEATVALTEIRHGGTRLQHMRHGTVSQRFGEFHAAQIRSIETGEFRSGRNQRADRFQQHMVGSERFAFPLIKANQRFVCSMLIAYGLML